MSHMISSTVSGGRSVSENYKYPSVNDVQRSLAELSERRTVSLRIVHEAHGEHYCKDLAEHKCVKSFSPPYPICQGNIDTLYPNFFQNRSPSIESLCDDLIGHF